MREVVLIRNKYVHAYQTIGKDFRKRFPDVEGFWSFGPEDDIAEKVEVSASLADRQRESEVEPYQQYPLPLAALAKHTGRSEVYL